MAWDSPLTISDLGQSDTGSGSSYSTGDLRRTYGITLSSKATELSIETDSLYRVLAKLRRKPVDETVFKTIEKRTSIHKRYAYPVKWVAWSGSGTVSSTDGDYSETADISSATPQTAGSFIAFKMKADYKSAGNITNVFGQSTGAISVGAAGTMPIFFMANQVIKICTKSSATGVTTDDYFLAKILSVVEDSTNVCVYVGTEVIRPIKTATNKYLCSFTAASTPISTVYNYSNGVALSGKTQLESMKAYVVSTAFTEGSGYPDTWADDPYSTKYFQTQIFKTTLSMTGSAMATVLKLEPNEWSRLWRDKLIQHNWDIADALYFSTLRTDSDGARHTQGIVDWLLNNSNVFGLTTSKTRDDLLEDLATWNDPRYGSFSRTLFVVPTHYYVWLHKLGGYALNNLKLAGGYASGYGSVATFDFASKGKLIGAETEVSQFGTLYGTMNVMKDIHLDGSPVKMIALNMDNVAYRPLIGNGENRDTTVYEKVQSIETNGVDARTDLIMTEAGLEITLPEAHAIWL